MSVTVISIGRESATLEGVSYHGLKAVAFTMDSGSNQIWCGCDAARVHHPGVQAHAYGCASFASVLVAKESIADILRRRKRFAFAARQTPSDDRVVVRVVRAAVFQALKRVLRRAVVLVGEAARRTRRDVFAGFTCRTAIPRLLALYSTEENNRRNAHA